MTDKKDQAQPAVSEKDVQIIDAFAKKLMELAGVECDIDTQIDKDNNAIYVDIQTDEAGLLIGNRGRTLYSLQKLLALMYMGTQDEWRRVLVNVADWREKEKEKLINLASNAAERAIQTGEEQVLYNLGPAQRRVVHLTLADYQGVETQSEGEGSQRQLKILPK